MPGDAPGVARAAAMLQRGGLVAFATETVYGLGANALDDAAVVGIFAAKGRPRFNPLIVHVPDFAQAARLADFPDIARELAAAFWPGPLTLVAPRAENCPLSLLVSAGLDSVALRAPSLPLAQALLRKTGFPIAAPSANISGRLSATTAADVAQSFGASVELVLDGGACPIGIESTVLGFQGSDVVLLRPGAITRAELEPITGALLEPEGSQIAGPGMLASHYAPRANLRLDATEAHDGEALLALGLTAQSNATAMANLSETGDLREAAANLFSMLRRLDASGASTIAVMPIPDTGLGEAINDRLRRAAAPRETAQ